MHNTRYFSKNFEQCCLEKTILRHFSYNLNVVPDGLPSLKMVKKTMKMFIICNFKPSGATNCTNGLFSLRPVISSSEKKSSTINSKELANLLLAGNSSDFKYAIKSARLTP